MNFLGMGPLEIVIILILGFLFFGPEKLPGMAAKAGRMYRNFRKATFDLSKTITDDMSSEDDIREDLASVGKSLRDDFEPQSDIKRKTRSMGIPEADKKWLEESAETTASTTTESSQDNGSNTDSTEITTSTTKPPRKRTTRKQADNKTPEPPLYEENM